MFEIWNVKGKRRRVIVKRANGKLETWRYQKGSGIRTKRKAKRVYKKTKTFSKTRVRLKTKKGSSTLETDNYGFINKTTEGYTNVGIVQTKRAMEHERFQWVAVLEIDGKVFTGYSQVSGKSKRGWKLSEPSSKDEAVERAILSARMSDVIPFYTFDFKYDSENRVLIYNRTKTEFIIGTIRSLYAQHYIKVTA